MRIVRTRPIEPQQVAEFFDLLGIARTAQLRAHAAAVRDRLKGGAFWQVNSTSAGGGVAEMLHMMIPLYRFLGVDARWAVVEGNAEFFTTTKRLGNLAYGSVAGEDRLRKGDSEGYLKHSDLEAAHLRELVRPDDVVLLHDHQTVGLAPLLRASVGTVFWRCHVGVDVPNEGSRAVWAFFAPLLADVNNIVFTLRRHVPDELAGLTSTVLPPVIWPSSAKNRLLSKELRLEYLRRCGLGGVASNDPSVAVLGDVTRDPFVPLAVQVSRWDRLKDMHGVLDAFAAAVPEGHLALVGPDPAAVPDDIDQQRWLLTCAEAWRAQPDRVRRRISVICLPMADLMENALLVNAIQSSADAVIQKSFAEGFGLTVTEAMWKGKVVVGSAVGGIAEQITHGRTGFLAQDPHDREELGSLIHFVLQHSADLDDIGLRAHTQVHRKFLPDRDVAAVAQMLSRR